MKVARIQNSLKDLNKDIGNCELQLKALKGKDGLSGAGRSQSVAKNPNIKSGNRLPSAPNLSRSCMGGTKQFIETERTRKSRSPNKGWSNEERNVLCKEVIGRRNSPTRVEVVVRTKSSKKRSRSVQPSRIDHETPTREQAGRNRSLALNQPSTERKNASWGHIFQQQSSSTGNINWKERGKVSAALRYPSSDDDDHSSAELQKWVQSIPHGRSKTVLKSPHLANGNVKTSDADGSDNYFSIFNPHRTLNFLVKELRGKIHKDYDENMLRIIDDMEKALCCLPLDACHSTPSGQTSSKQTALQPNARCSSSKPRYSMDHISDHSESLSKDRTKILHPEQDNVLQENSPNLVGRLLSTVSRITKIAGMPEKTEEINCEQKGRQPKPKSSTQNLAAESLQAQLESGCKQLEETCRQMEETCETLRQQKNQLMDDLNHKTQQLETVINKNQQLTIYAADIRQEMLRVQQAAEMAQQEHIKTKQKLLAQINEMKESNFRMNQRLEETLQENERSNTELQLCRLERDKMLILMSNKDLEVAKLKKEIVDVNTLVTEQLANIRNLTGRKGSSDDLGKMMQAVSRLYDTVDGANGALKQQCEQEAFKKHIGDGEGSRSRPICSSPTSSVNSSLYSSWQMMSDITTDHNHPEEKVKSGERMVNFPIETVSLKGKDSGFNTATPVYNQETTSKASETDSTTKKENSAKELKAGLQDMFHLMKKQTSEAINITLPSPPKGFDKVPETLGLSQWTELSASESTVLFHSSDDSDSIQFS
ncbi:uncharacterized protein LOC117647123 [Thrips palmi]|uniref:Uncharacterized protein LOC117647123 n=1 Tax=Thrips palmi TaxID=161013 RepID=A0A6P8Z4B0_THRPL|nr:uncharacterized protein LOC117647123 [Thrips palmi]